MVVVDDVDVVVVVVVGATVVDEIVVVVVVVVVVVILFFNILLLGTICFANTDLVRNSFQKRHNAYKNLVFDKLFSFEVINLSRFTMILP